MQELSLFFSIPHRKRYGIENRYLITFATAKKKYYHEAPIIFLNDFKYCHCMLFPFLYKSVKFVTLWRHSPFAKQI